eukprot:symbB.v1.2.036906.t1/scaffold5321.1/size28434/1
MQGGTTEGAETAAPTTAPPTAPWSAPTATDATTASPAPTGSASRGGYGSRRNQSGTAPASPAPGGQEDGSSF